MNTRKRTVLEGAILAAVLAFVTISTAVSFNSCALIQQVTNLTRLQFKLQDANHYSLCGVDLTNKHSVSDFGIMDGINVAAAFAANRFPLTFTLNVAAKNPNQPTTNDKSMSTIQLTEFPWRLLIDGKETISGGIGSPISVPPGGTTATIPLQVSVDLKQFFAEKGYAELANLAMAVSGSGTAKLQLKAQPTMSAPIVGSIRYPNELTIVNTEFRN